MSQHAIIKLVQMAESDKALMAELQQARSLKEQSAVACKHGCHVRVDELATLSALAKRDAGDELSEAELEMVAAGSIWGAIKSAAKWVYNHVYVDVKNGVVGGKGKF